ncbi:hypothetical protein TD95_002900 [Thielaviopsis punctulata]|uniref:Peptidase M14 domain-containing protein n=1 Tax=Thielaviopsis punctulata TaxID=72032 RepID=A0A0F4ZDG2_9PEZI|nr:hypothetical protein TD95_002900 [Thielaviopsis punctulata]
MRFTALLSLAASATACNFDYPTAVRLHHRDNTTDGSTIGEADLLPISTTDRFHGGAVAPKGLSALHNPAYLFDRLMSVTEVYSAMKSFRNFFGAELFDAPHKTAEGRTVHGVRIPPLGRPATVDKYHVVLVSQVHARERGASDNVILFLSDLLWAHKNGEGLDYGLVTYSADQVRQALGVGLVVLPMPNPDGVLWDQQTNTCWRKNRNPESAIAGEDRSIGVDINRNWDILWNSTEAFAHDYAPSSADPSSDVFMGTGPNSEPEVQNVIWTVDTHPGTTHFMDIHTYSNIVEYSWGFNWAQTTDPSMSFQNRSWDGLRGAADSGYMEYITEADNATLSAIANAVADKATITAGEYWWAGMPGVELYPMSGDAMDYFNSLHYIDPSRKPIRAFDMEFGAPNFDYMHCPFYPNSTVYHQWLVDTSVAFMEFLLQAADA